MADKFSKVVIRKGGLEDVWLSRGTGFTNELKDAERFSTQSEATAKAENLGIRDYGLFPLSSNPVKP